MASKVLPSGLSNLEWFFLTSRYHACVLLCLEDVMDEDGARAIARRFDGLVVRPFCARTGMALDGAAMADNIMLVNSSEPVGLEQALSDCARWFADRQERSTPLAGLYCVGSGSEGLADRLSAPACRSVAIMVATHALIDGLSLPKVDLEAGPAASGGGETTSEQAVTLPLPARLRAWMDGAITAGTDVLRAAVSRPGAGHFVGIVADADRDRVGAAARLLGVSSEALCYALALAPLFASGAPRTPSMPR